MKTKLSFNVQVQLDRSDDMLRLIPTSFSNIAGIAFDAHTRHCKKLLRPSSSETNDLRHRIGVSFSKSKFRLLRGQAHYLSRPIFTIDPGK